jgi:FG-GAP repeat
MATRAFVLSHQLRARTGAGAARVRIHRRLATTFDARAATSLAAALPRRWRVGLRFRSLLGALCVLRGDGTRLTGRIRLTAESVVMRQSLTEREMSSGQKFMDNDGLGTTIALGDIDGDGSSDLLTAAPGTMMPGLFDHWSGGTVYLIPGSTATPQ